MANYRAWFKEVWPWKARYVLGEVASIAKQHPLFLADLALRGNVYAETLPDTDPIKVGMFLGRRALALETLKLCKLTPDELFGLLDRKPEERTDART